ncbi:hypothetical protein SAMCFNEI73_pC0367 (plasmid) [Sinorhizobium americanum]|uniref:Uncharacterized protein n=1 Tax=Sinorhizobium americanum TaxID=194963 RepID=A0A1L3LVF0_9HYPH|nr:hypothetical protein SAMCFNEI73_pC0367 [Sinorhizobium americanum]
MRPSRDHGHRRGLADDRVIDFEAARLEIVSVTGVTTKVAKVSR